MHDDISINRDASEVNISQLLKQATVQANDKNYEAAIASLRHAYTLMETASTEWPIKTYFRLARYLHLSGEYEGAIAWLQQLLDELDERCDAREALYKEWGWMQEGNKPATIRKSTRNSLMREIKEEIAIFKEREKKNQQRLQKKTAVMKSFVTTRDKAKIVPHSNPKTASDVGAILFNFTQRCFIGEMSCSEVNLEAENFVFDWLDSGAITAHDVHQLPPKYRAVVRQLLTQYIIFLEMNRNLLFPPKFLDDSSSEKLGAGILSYICQYRWPFPQMFDRQ